MDASTAKGNKPPQFVSKSKKMDTKGCAYCGSKRHGTVKCMLHKPKGFWLEYWTDPKEDIYTPKDGIPITGTTKYVAQSSTPTIPVSEVSRLLVNAKKNMQRHFSLDCNERFVVEECFKEIRKRLNLRGRGRCGK